MGPLAPAAQVWLGAVTLAAAYWDWRSRRIPNWLAATGAAAGFGLHAALAGGDGLLLALKGCALALAVYFPLFALRALGAGDAKLMGAVGAIVGPGNWIWIFLITSLLGGMAAVAAVVAQGRLLRTLSNVAVIFRDLAGLRAPHHSRPELATGSRNALALPHAPVVACGSLLFLALLHAGGGRN